MLLVVVVVLAVPLITALVLLREPRWYPAYDQALTEMRVRDVGSTDPPLVGFYSRFERLGKQASHPGPVFFWAMWPVYRILGARSWSMMVAAVLLHIAAIAVLLWIARRRGKFGIMLAVALAVAVLMRACGSTVFTEAWSPYLPVLCWLVFVFAIWSLISGDVPMLPVVAMAGSLCVQSHVGYAGLVAGLGVVGLVAVAIRVGRGLMNELARHGFDVGTHTALPAEVTPNHFLRRRDADTVVVLAAGSAIAEWRAKDGSPDRIRRSEDAEPEGDVHTPRCPGARRTPCGGTAGGR